MEFQREEIQAYLNSIYPVSRETFERLCSLVDGLVQWQRKINLVSGSTVDQIWRRHVADSLQLLSVKPEARAWLDLGSGGGFPGLVIAACMTEFPGALVSLVESNGKKAAFLRQMNREMDAGARIYNMRIEDAASRIDVPDVVTARALAAMPRLLELAFPWLSNGAIGLFHKGRGYERELEECNGVWRFDLVKHHSAVEEDSVLLEVVNLQRHEFMTKNRNS